MRPIIRDFFSLTILMSFILISNAYRTLMLTDWI